ncbi:cell division protein FtsL [Psychrobacter sp. M13]|uniref:cell division protein FtsL n=1 Tax=Psychrobacter sp. M13 TaxID=3067275 RepID=UPI00273CC49B|nr:cell division protein FtsL [Psychrobacter sp. M13]WLP94412.1 cell division protein FtsL [Psychrobacter sp. M13]
MALSGKPTTRHKATSQATTDVSEIFVQRFNVVSIYVLVLLLLAAGIIWSGIKTADGVQQYHQDYKTLQDMKKQHRKLQVEHQRLLIEQQTFSATPQIASRAVSELNMYSPTLKDKLIIQLGAPVAASATPKPVVADNNELDESLEATPNALGAGQ